MAHVAREITAHVLRFGKLAVLLLELALLLVDANKQRVHLFVDLVFERAGEIERIDRLHDALRKLFGQQEHQGHGDDERHQNRHEHVAQKRQQRMTRLGQAHERAVVKLHGRVHGVGSKRFRITHGHGLARLRSLLHFGAVGMVVHARRVGSAVEEHRSVRADQRVAGQPRELLLERRKVGRRRRGVQIRGGVLRVRGDFRLGVVLVGQVINGGHDHSQHQDNAQRERKDAREDFP